LCNVAEQSVAQSEKIWFAVKDGMEDQNLMSVIENNTTAFLNACNDAILKNKKPTFPARTIARNSEKQILSFWDTTPMYSSKSFISEKCLKKASGGYQVRNIPVTIPGAPEDQQEQEIVINYTNTGEIDNIAISVEETRYREIMEEFITIEDFNRRQVIVDFVENFRTSYNMKDIKFIETVFSEQALIITGKVVKIAPSKDMAINALMGTEKITYVTQTKKEYITNLKNTFSRNRYIDIQFEDIDVVRHPKNDYLYGVTLRQKWGSSTYNDTGYVFLMIDFKNELEPMIHVRTWQPDKIGGRDINKDELFNLNDFNIQNL
jgi:hypothetical protein